MGNIINDHIIDKGSDLLGLLFPYVGITKKAVDIYIENINKLDLPPDQKAFMVFNTKKTLKKLKNQKEIAQIAMNNSGQDTDFSSLSGVNEEWLDRFMDSAGFVSSEEIQLIWGKILANEFNIPGSTPPNMIRVLSEITPNLAQAFRIICSMSIEIFPLNESGEIGSEDRVVLVPYIKNAERFNEIGLSFKDINELEVLGVIRFDPTNGYSYNCPNEKMLVYIGDKLELIEKRAIPLGNIMLTSVGECLLSITDVFKVEGYYHMIIDYMNKKGVKCSKQHSFVAEIIDNKLYINNR